MAFFRPWANRSRPQLRMFGSRLRRGRFCRMAGTTRRGQAFLVAAATPSPVSGSRWWGCHQAPMAALILSGGQHGQHNHSYHCRRNTFGSRRRLVRTRRLVLTDGVFQATRLSGRKKKARNGKLVTGQGQEFDAEQPLRWHGLHWLLSCHSAARQNGSACWFSSVLSMTSRPQFPRKTELCRVWLVRCLCLHMMKKKIVAAPSGSSICVSGRKPMPQKHGRSTRLPSKRFATARENSESSDSRAKK